MQLLLSLPARDRCADSYSAVIAALAFDNKCSTALSLLDEAIAQAGVAASSAGQSPRAGDRGGEGGVGAGGEHLVGHGVLDVRIFSAALRACDTPAEMLQIQHKMFARNLILDAESAAILAAARRLSVRACVRL